MLAIKEKNKDNEEYIYYLVGQNLKRIRKEKNIKVRELALKSNYSEGYIMNIESSKYLQTFSLGVLWTFSKVLNVDITEFFKELKNN